jgi:magnesium transporter
MASEIKAQQLSAANDAAEWSSVPETAGQHLVRSVPTALADMTCAEVLRALTGREFDYADAVVISDGTRQVLGAASVGRLMATAPQIPVREVMQSVPLVSFDTDQERVASLAIETPLALAVVIDSAGALVGVVPPQTLLAVLRREHIEDLHRLTGVMREREFARDAIEGPPARRAIHRLPWLLVGLIGSIVAALIVAQFETTLESRIAVAFFVPGIVYLADAIGTQTEAIAVRGLSLSHQSISHLLAQELRTGALIGAVLATLAFMGVWIVLGDLPLAIALGLALIAAGSIATIVGLLLPWLFHRFGADPAYGSGPLATVIQDILSLLVYFTCVASLL